MSVLHSRIRHGSRRTPRLRALALIALLLCLAGTVITCLAANAVLLVAGLELANAGALLLGVAGTAPPEAGSQCPCQVRGGGLA